MDKENATKGDGCCEKRWKTVDSYKSKSRDIRLVEWPGTGKQVGILRMNCAEIQKARFEAIEYFDKKNIKIDLFSSAALDAEEMVQQCHIFLIDPDASNPNYRVFRGADEARNRLTDDERYYFCQKYNELFNESGR